VLGCEPVRVVQRRTVDLVEAVLDARGGIGFAEPDDPAAEVGVRVGDGDSKRSAAVRSAMRSPS
jgi:hypothetical protein